MAGDSAHSSHGKSSVLTSQKLKTVSLGTNRSKQDTEDSTETFCHIIPDEGSVVCLCCRETEDVLRDGKGVESPGVCSPAGQAGGTPVDPRGPDFPRRFRSTPLSGALIFSEHHRSLLRAWKVPVTYGLLKR